MHTLRSIHIIWYREILRYWRDKSRIVSSFAFPFIFLFVFGSGLSPAMGGLTAGLARANLPGGASGGEIDFVKFIFPGIIGMNVLMTSIMSGVSVVWDREFGFLKEVLVAPISRAAVVLGKTLGGSTVAVIQGLLMLVFAPFIGVTITVGMVAQLVPLMFLAAFAMTSLGVLIAARMRSMEGFQMIIQFVTFPMIFMSGALFPMRDLPAWMNLLVKINPVTYAIDPLRQVVFRSQGLSEAVLGMFPQLGLGVTVLGHAMTMRDDILIIASFGTAMIGAAVWAFSLQD
ncbi:MAG: ABC transporter permease [Anaerolineae bacterium]